MQMPIKINRKSRERKLQKPLGCNLVSSFLVPSLILSGALGGCNLSGDSHSIIQPSAANPKEASLYIVDDVPGQLHSSLFHLTNETDRTKIFRLLGVSCGCLTCELGGRTLKKGDVVHITPGHAETVVLKNHLAYAEGFYSNSAYFEDTSRAGVQLALESPYLVVKRIRISPGAAVFESAEDGVSFWSKLKICYRGTVTTDGHIQLIGLPSIVKWDAEQSVSDGERSFVPGGRTFREAIWELTLRLDATHANDSPFNPNGDLQIRVVDNKGELMTAITLPYNAENVFREVEN